MKENTKEMEISTLGTMIVKLAKQIAEIKKNYKPIFRGESYLTDSELTERLKTSKRTLQTWRSDGIVSYVNLGGKVLYVESEVQQMLDQRHYKSYKLD